MKLKDLHNDEIEYPKYTPPLCLKLQSWFLDASASNGLGVSVSRSEFFLMLRVFLSYIIEDFD